MKAIATSKSAGEIRGGGRSSGAGAEERAGEDVVEGVEGEFGPMNYNNFNEIIENS